MEIAIGAQVYGREGQKVGEVSHVVVDAESGQMTHVVVSKGWLLPRDIVVPIDTMSRTTGQEIQLTLNENELEQQPDFVETHYIQPEDGDPVPAGYTAGNYLYRPLMPPMGAGWYMPGGYPMTAPMAPVETELNIPEGSTVLSEGMDILVGDEKVGSLAGVRVHPRRGVVTHLVISRGWLFPEERVVPASGVRAVDELGVHLSASPDELRASARPEVA